MQNIKELNKKLDYYFESFDTVDLISKIGALNLVFKNQHKNLIFSYATIYGLSHINQNKPKISQKRFKELIEIIDKAGLLTSIEDPAESPFFEKICIDRDYYLFNGFNHSSVFVANNIVKTLLYHAGDLPDELLGLYFGIITCCANISTNIWKRLNINWEDIMNHGDFQIPVVVPPNLTDLKQLLIIKKEELLKYVDLQQIDKYLVCNALINNDYKKELEEEYPFYYRRPLYKIDDDNYLLLDPTSLGIYIKEIGLELSVLFGCKDKFIKQYHRYIAKITEQNAKLLAGIEFDSKELDMDLDEGDYFSQSFFKISDSKLLYLIVFFDYGYDVGPQPIIPDSIIEKAFKNAFEQGYSKDNIFSLACISPFGGLLSLNIGFDFTNPPIMVKCDELNAIRINQINTPWFLERMADTLKFYFTDETSSLLVGHSNFIAMLYEKDYDLYFDDNFSVKGNFLNIGFDFIYPYVTKAASYEEETSIFIPQFDVPLSMIKFDDNIYTINLLVGIISKTGLLYSKYKNAAIYVFFKIEDRNSHLLGRIICYWMNELSTFLDRYLIGDVYINLSYNDSVEINVSKKGNASYLVEYSLEYFMSGNSNNYNEIKLLIQLLNLMGLFNNECASLLKNKSDCGDKKIGYAVNSENNPALIPMNESVPFVVASELVESIINDQIGHYIVNELKMPYGKVDNAIDLTHKIVNYLFEKFESFLSLYDWKQTIRFSYLCSESITRELLLEIDNIKHQVLLYPNHEDEIENRYNKINSSSVCVRFIVEYLSAVHTSGTKKMDYIDFQYLVTLANSIIKWAKTSDSIHCNLIDDLTILKSKRVGFKKNKIDKFGELVSETSIYDLSHKIEYSFGAHQEWPYKKELNEAYLSEYGFTMDDLMKVVTFLVAFGDRQNSDIKQATINEIMEAFHNYSTVEISDELFKRVLDCISLSRREKYLDGVIENRHLYPWKYNRIYSLTRKPVINCGDYYIWGNRTLYHSYLFIYQTIFDGKEPSSKTGSGKIAVLNGKILQHEGDVFNDFCYEFLKQKMPEISFYPKIKSVNNKRIESSKNQDLGDIDVLGIDHTKKRIYLIETKKFNYSRDPYELDTEMKEMFGTASKRKNYLQLELNRLQWVKDHIEDFICEYDLKGDGWKVYYTFLSNKPLISCHFASAEINHTSIKNIDINYLRKLKYY